MTENVTLPFEPANPAWLVNLGMALEEHGELAQAIVAYRAAWRLDPNNTQIQNTLNAALAHEG